MSSKGNIQSTPSAVVVGRPNPNLLGQCRALGRSGINVYAIITRGESPRIARASRFIQDVIDIRDNPSKKITDKIARINEADGCKPVIFYGGDADISLIASCWPELQRYAIAATPPEPAAALLDKCSQFQRVTSAGIHVPRFNRIDNQDDLSGIVRDFQFPVICRPVELSRSGSTVWKLFTCTDNRELSQRVVPLLSKEDVSILVQEYIPGGDNHCLFALASCDNDGSPMQMVTGRKLLQYPPGLMCVGETIIDHKLEEMAGRCLNALGLSGTIGVELKYHEESGEYFYIEANFRAENFISIAEAAGVNILETSYRYASGVARDPKPDHYKHVIWKDISVITKARLTGIPMPNYTRLSNTKIIDAMFSMDDPLPALGWYGVKSVERLRHSLHI